ncbi:uncharacterized protein N7500_000807 [Penicillium coprophilum]|uniref:uncharacterized protein n=1 Tax=Penicillium coprophilum TaxID=36646 RepID=UPI0023852569|nr:uncharacterized protein N7500_000807 [Penicillium coprophilum]KAJ5178108.1 hypothetical protein N7500_000807 [Penicillium coprophilum]
MIDGRNRIIRRAIIDRDEVAVMDSRAIYIQVKHLHLSFFFKVLYLPHLYSPCLLAPATAAPASATPALVPAASTKPAHTPSPPPSSSNTTHTRPGLPLLSN